MNLILIPLVVLAGMGLSLEAGLIGPLGTEVGHLWATLSIFGVGSVLTGLLVLFFSPRNTPAFTQLPGWQLLGGVLGPVYVIVLTLATPLIGIGLTMIAILSGQIAKSLMIDHFGWFGSPAKKVGSERLLALVFILAALILIAWS
ncbi:DMT family transporter [Hafnia psychrotolerans]|jgi:transporter family-2 protein|uniref:DMT family transporter n=1 Tax=Hafnia psychrotolerans TaxID=1477018 RepID=A0ABQ1G6V9_9GAMM|nr:DMT family transporter [Hafnia psychrotolerans]GGA37916.1 hypothetical protein GCM10011328_11050 [Hafnia psychrotolerans]